MSKELGPCPLCGGEAQYIGTCGVECSAEDCMMAVCSPVVWNRLSTLAEQNRRRGEALERCRWWFDESISVEEVVLSGRDCSAKGMRELCEEALK